MGWRIFGKRTPQKLLYRFWSDSGILCVLGDNVPRPVAKKEDIAAAYPPEVKRSIVDGRGILRGHQRLQAWQIRQQLCRARQCNLAKSLRVAEREDRIDEVRRELAAYLSLHAVADNQQTGDRQPQ